MDQQATIEEAWDGTTLKINFRRCFSPDMMLEWNSLFEDIKNVILTDRPDTLVWKYKTKGLYTVKSFYNIVNFRGILPGVKPVVWKTKIPPRIQIFCWLIMNNKLLTRDNLCKRQHVPDKTCLFCSEH